MNIHYNIVSTIVDLYSPTQNLNLFHVLYSESKTDKYKAFKLQSTLNSLTTTITDFPSRQVQLLAGAFLLIPHKRENKCEELCD